MKGNQVLRYTGKDVQHWTMKEWLQTKSPALRPLAAGWFNQIQNCGADVHAIFHDGCPMACVDNAPFAYVNAFTTHVNIGFFYGAYLSDKLKLLHGSGRHMRHIKLFPESPAPEKAIKALLAASYVDIKCRLDSASILKNDLP